MFFIKFAAVLYWKFLVDKFRYFVCVIGCLNAIGTLPKTRLANMWKEDALLTARGSKRQSFSSISICPTEATTQLADEASYFLR